MKVTLDVDMACPKCGAEPTVAQMKDVAAKNVLTCTACGSLGGIRQWIVHIMAVKPA